MPARSFNVWGLWGVVAKIARLRHNMPQSGAWTPSSACGIGSPFRIGGYSRRRAYTQEAPGED